ncbi:hypothetical protein [Novosphingobium sp. Fuku2-ISO-50]|uniref:hypothetical protein n=1 Tax=Novosphingobium sp. Fuku2-ISO-50 TaxID=1739114 RepID=UPI00076D47F1|nr:hypothetical protein [Novosphingobium sp. Fuku2-ISO-50]KUR75207.1 hypothetical protein AQZ50_16450 [Novosphingobium sp. Fuku2-ISO-50]
MSWLDAIQLRDLDADTRLELTCRACGKVRFVTPAQLLALGDFGHLWLSEVQARARCKQRGCKGAMRLSMPHRGETKGFVGGIA